MSLAYFTSRHRYWASWNRRTRRMSSVLQDTVSAAPAPARRPPALRPPLRAYLFPENMGPKITWGQNGALRTAASGEPRSPLSPAPYLYLPPARIRGSIVPVSAPSSMPERVAVPVTAPTPVPQGGTCTYPPARAPGLPRTWICPRGRLGEPGWTPGTVRQFMADCRPEPARAEPVGPISQSEEASPPRAAALANRERVCTAARKRCPIGAKGAKFFIFLCPPAPSPGPQRPMADGPAPGLWPRLHGLVQPLGSGLASGSANGSAPAPPPLRLRPSAGRLPGNGIGMGTGNGIGMGTGSGPTMGGWRDMSAEVRPRGRAERGSRPGRRPGALAWPRRCPAASPQELEDHYSPSRWSPRLDRDTIIDAHLAVTAAGGDRGSGTGAALRATAPCSTASPPQEPSGPGPAGRPCCTCPTATGTARSWTSTFPRTLLKVSGGVAGTGAGRVDTRLTPRCAAQPSRRWSTSTADTGSA